MITCKFRPIETWPRPWTKDRRNSPFRAGYNDTLQKLEKEIEELNGRNIVIQLALTERDLRLDGWPRANARPSHPGVIVTFDSFHGSLQRVCDEFPDWVSNMRGIAYTMERLRTAEAYGVTKGGQQYRGWQALPPPPADNTPNNAVDAARVLASVSGMDMAAILSEPAYFQRAYRAAAKRCHPDVGGSEATMKQLNLIADILKARHGL